jgi:hypothetical protein
MTRLYRRIVAGALLCLPMVVAAFGQAPIPVPVPTPAPAYGSYPVPTPVPTPVQILQAPAILTIPEGTYITVEVTDQLSSDRSRPDDAFTSILHQPIVVDGWVVARAGQPVMGRVVAVQKSGQVKGKSNIGIELGELILVDGQQIPIQTQTIKDQANSSTGRDFAAIAATTGFGALIGAGLGGGSGAAIGASIGAGAGAAGVLATPGDTAKIHPERVLAFRLDDAVTITTVRSQQAFLPATPSDYAQPAPPSGPPVLQQPVYYVAPAPRVVEVPYGYPRYYRRY